MLTHKPFEGLGNRVAPKPLSLNVELEGFGFRVQASWRFGLTGLRVLYSLLRQSSLQVGPRSGHFHSSHQDN